METVKVKIADLAVLRDRGILITVGLGSCVGIAIYDSSNRVGGLAHILLADSEQFKNKGNNFNQAKFANTAIPVMVKEIEKLGGKPGKSYAKIAGGSQLFDFQKAGISVGEKNIEAVRNTLKQLGIPVKGEDVGGNHGRTMRFFVDSGRVAISTVGKGEKEI